MSLNESHQLNVHNFACGLRLLLSWLEVVEDGNSKRNLPVSLETLNFLGNFISFSRTARTAVEIRYIPNRLSTVIPASYYPCS
jgi:hypothetical protein